MSITNTKPAKPSRSSVTPALFQSILVKVSAGLTLTDVLKGKDLPSRTSFLRFLNAGTEGEIAAKRLSYTRAREHQAEAWADEIISISDDTSQDEITEQREGREVTRVNHENINRSRLRVDARKWLMAKLHPKLYGDSVALPLTLEAGDTLGQLLNQIRATPALPRRVNGIHSVDTLPQPVSAPTTPPPLSAIPPQRVEPSLRPEEKTGDGARESVMTALGDG